MLISGNTATFTPVNCAFFLPPGQGYDAMHLLTSWTHSTGPKRAMALFLETYSDEQGEIIISGDWCVNIIQLSLIPLPWGPGYDIS